jgi:O-antigen ligase
VVFVGILHEQVFPRFDTATIEHEGSVSERITSLQDARVLLNDHPFIGVGAGNFTAGIIEKGEKGLMGERGGETVKGEMGSRPVWSIQPVHNVFILIWSELGLIGIVLFVLFLFFILKSSITNHNSAILIAIFPSLFLDHWLWSSHFGLLFFFLLLGLASRKQLTE